MRLSHLSAVAVMIALVAAMFVALQSVSAAGCALNPGLTLGFNENCDIDVSKLHEDATGLVEVRVGDDDILTIGMTDDEDDATSNINIAAGTATGTRTVNLTAADNYNTPADDDTDPDVIEGASIEVTVAGFGIVKVEVVGDSDNVVPAGAPVKVRATIRSADSSNADVRLTVPTTGLSISTGEHSSSQVHKMDVDAPSAAAPLGVVDFTVNTAGAPAGDYKLTFTADNNGNFNDDAGTAEADKRATATLTLTIGDPGTGLASATLSLGNSAEDLPFTDANEAVAETGSAAADDGSINLVVEVFDSLGGKANSGAINQIIVIAPGGKISSMHDTGADDEDDNDITAGGSSSATLSEVDADDTEDDVDDVGQSTVITVGKDDGKPGQVTVYAIVSGPGGAARTEDFTLSFSGPAASMSIADAPESLLSVNPVDDPETTNVDEADEDEIKLLVTAEDSGGNSTAPPTGNVSIVITDPDGKRKGTSVIARSQPTKGADGKYYITLTGKGNASAPLAAGEWTLTAKSGELEAEASFAVAGAAADVAVSADATSSDTIGDVITVTASVTDKDGNTVSNGTMVMFDVSEDTGLAAIGTGHAGKATKDGAASVKYAVVGAGHSVISATADDATGVIVIDSTAGATDMAMPEEEAGLSCLSSLSGFSTWTCDVEASASEIFDWISSRGATALHLNSNRMWVRYSVVDGAMVPGSSDFMVTKSDILYISN